MRPDEGRPETGPLAMGGIQLSQCRLDRNLANSLAGLELMIGHWKIDATFVNADGTERHTQAELEGRYILSGFGIQTVEVHTPNKTVFAEAGSTFVTTTIFNYDTANQKWSGASVNSLGNREFVDGTFDDGRLVLIQRGKLFRGRDGQNRLTFSNVAADRFEYHLDTYDEGTGSWTNGSYRYVATRRTP